MVHPHAKPETRKALTVGCPTCGMPAGAGCTSGRRRAAPHAARKQLAEVRRGTLAREEAQLPEYCHHLLTMEAGPADDMDPDCATLAFACRCICGHDIPWGPYEAMMTAIRAHLVDEGLLGADSDGSDQGG